MTRPRDRSDLIWSAWLGSSLLSFAVIEAIAYRSCRFETLSRSLRRWFGIHPANRRHHVSLLAYLGFWLGLLVHLETLDRHLKPPAKGTQC
jgi:hypothetical protein